MPHKDMHISGWSYVQTLGIDDSVSQQLWCVRLVTKVLEIQLPIKLSESLRKSLNSVFFLFYYFCTIILGIHFIQFPCESKAKLSQKVSLGTQTGLITPSPLKFSNKWMIEVLVRHYFRECQPHFLRILTLFSHEVHHSACFRSLPRQDSSPKWCH